MPTSSYPESEWLLRRPLIENLYSVQGCTMDEVREHLSQTGLHVNTRMVKTRLLKWNLHKKLSLIEARTALELIGPHSGSWPCEQPRFRIRSRVVGLDRILRFCRRRRIHDPFHWIQNTPRNGPRSPNVEILLPITRATAECNLAQQMAATSAEASASQLSQATDHVGGFRARYNEQNVRVSLGEAPEGKGSTELAINRVRDPHVYILAAEAIQGFRSYCLKYTTCEGKAAEHHEPPVHHNTVQGRLQNHIDEGVFYFVRNDMDSAFASFRLAFLVLEELLEDTQPMSIAQYLMLLCRLTANKANAVAGKLLEQALRLAQTRRPIASGLLQALHAIYGSGEFLEMPLLCLRAAVECMEQTVSTKWKSLYVKERYCHALALAGFTGEGAKTRAKLLEEQQSHYGAAARNVLWTALIVAEDCIGQLQLQEAEYRYNCVLQESNALSGLPRAKVRAGAFSGLARAAMVRARQYYGSDSSSWTNLHGRQVALGELRSAGIFAREARELAQKYFDPTETRRITLLHDLEAEVLALSQQVGCQA